LALAEADGKPRVAAPNNMTPPNRNETSVFIVNVPFEDLSALHSATLMPAANAQERDCLNQWKRDAFAPPAGTPQIFRRRFSRMNTD
jgi:hypothetical protein